MRDIKIHQNKITGLSPEGCKIVEGLNFSEKNNIFNSEQNEKANVLWNKPVLFWGEYCFKILTAYNINNSKLYLCEIGSIRLVFILHKSGNYNIISEDNYIKIVENIEKLHQKKILIAWKKTNIFNNFWNKQNN